MAEIAVLKAVISLGDSRSYGCQPQFATQLLNFGINLRRRNRKKVQLYRWGVIAGIPAALLLARAAASLSGLFTLGRRRHSGSG